MIRVVFTGVLAFVVVGFETPTGADPGFSERGGCTDVGDLEGAARPLPTKGVWGHAPPEKFEI